MCSYFLIVLLAVFGFSFQTLAGHEDHKEPGSGGHTAAVSGKIDANAGFEMVIKGNSESRWLKNVERNVDYQVHLALHAYSKEIRKGELTVIGAVDEFINAYGKGVGRIVITNVNGEKDVEAIKKHPVFSKISTELKTLSVGRISNK